MKAALRFDVNASFPPDRVHRPAIEALVSQAAACAGCAPDVAANLAAEAGEAFEAGARAARDATPITVRVDRATGTIEVIISDGCTVRFSRPVPVAT